MALLPPLEHQKNNLRCELRCDKEGSLKDLCAQKSRSFLYGLSAESSHHSSGHGGLCSAALQSKHLTSPTKALPAKPVARRKEGVDRAYPLKPISHHKGVSVAAANTAQLRSSPYMEEAPKCRPSSKSKEKPPAGRSPVAAVLCPWTAEPKQPASHLHRRELAYTLKLEEEGRIMEKQIQKEVARLREKLMRTAEVLRRIQKERELVEVEERRHREAERTCEQKPRRCPEEKTLRAAVRPGGGAFSGAQSAWATLHPQELDMERLKKERLLASNSKIQDHIHMEHLASCSKLAPKHSSSSALLERGSVDHLSTEALDMQAASAVEQQELRQCSFCGRNFLCVRLKKHMSICSKSQGSKRKVFDSRKARARGTDLEEFQQWKTSERPQNMLPRRNNWREKHEAFISTVHQARQVQQILSKGGKMSDLPRLPPIKNPDYVACPYCRRRFDPQVAERHVPKCKTIKNRPLPPLQRRRC